MIAIQMNWLVSRWWGTLAINGLTQESQIISTPTKIDERILRIHLIIT